MNIEHLEMKELVLIAYLEKIFNENSKVKWKVKAEYSTSDKEDRVVTVQEQAGEKIVFYCDIDPLYNYYMVDIYGLSIKECKNLSLLVGNLIGKNVYVKGQKSSNFDKFNIDEDGKETWQIMFKQYTNPQAIEYMDIKRVGYNATLQCIISKIYEKEEE